MARRPHRQSRPPGRLIIRVIKTAYYDRHERSVANAHPRRSGPRLLIVRALQCPEVKTVDLLDPPSGRIRSVAAVEQDELGGLHDFPLPFTRLFHNPRFP